MTDKEQIIKDTYYDADTGFVGIDKLSKKLSKHKITKAEISKVLKNQEVYQINQRTTHDQSFIPMYPLQEFQIDLIYLEHTHLNDASYGLCCIDVFTKKADIQLMKKKNEIETTNAMKIILDKMGVPESIYCDEGTEFNNKHFKKLLSDNNIELILTLRHAPFVERFNRTIKEMLYKYMFVTKSKTIVKVLPKLLNNYNNSYHKAIKMTPNEVNDKNVLDVLNNIIASAKKPIERPKIKIGDTVRVLLKEKGNDKKYKKRWSKTVHTISDIDGQKYKIKDLDRTYLRAYLLKIDTVENPTIEPDLEGTREGHLRDIAKRTLIPVEKILKDNVPLTRNEKKRLDSTLTDKLIIPKDIKRVPKKKQ